MLYLNHMDYLNFNLDIDSFWSRLKLLTKSRKVTLEKLCTDIGVLYANMKNKKFRKTLPTTIELVKISIYFNVPLEWLLLGNTDNPYQKRIQELEEKLEQIKTLIPS